MKINDLDPDFVITEYGKGQSACQIAEQLGCSHTLILHFLAKYHIVKTDVRQLKRKHKTVKEDYFDIIDTQEKAYFLGLMFADGNNSISDNSSIVSINLQEGDKEILEKFSMAIFDKVILKFHDNSEDNHKNQYLLRINNKRMCKQLEKLGCIPNKSLTLKWPQWLIDPDLQRHFIRGYFDGDGTIYSDDEHTSFGFGIMSTNDFCTNVDRVVNEHIKVYFGYEVPYENGITTDISVYGNRNILKLLNWLYKDATVYLERKYQKYVKLKSWTEDVDKRKNGLGHHINQYM
jgi:hypothetical protein